LLLSYKANKFEILRAIALPLLKLCWIQILIIY